MKKSAKKKNNLFSIRKKKILVNEKKLEMQKLVLRLSIVRNKIIRSNKAKNKLKPLNKDLDKKSFYFDKDISLLKNKLNELYREKVLIRKKKSHVDKSIRKMNDSVKKDNMRIIELEKRIKEMKKKK